MLQRFWIEAVFYSWKARVFLGHLFSSGPAAQEGPVAAKGQEDDRFSLRSKVVPAMGKRNESYKAIWGTQPKQNMQCAQQLGSRGQRLGWFAEKVAHPCPHGSPNSVPTSQHWGCRDISCPVTMQCVCPQRSSWEEIRHPQGPLDQGPRQALWISEISPASRVL